MTRSVPSEHTLQSILIKSFLCLTIYLRRRSGTLYVLYKGELRVSSVVFKTGRSGGLGRQGGSLGSMCSG